MTLNENLSGIYNMLHRTSFFYGVSKNKIKQNNYSKWMNKKN